MQSPLFIQLLEHLRAHQITHTPNLIEQEARFNYVHPLGTCPVTLRTDEDPGCFVARIDLPVTVRPEQLAIAAELVLRINGPMRYARMDLDYESCRISQVFNLHLPTEGLSTALFRQGLGNSFNSIDEWVPPMRSALAGECSPVEAVRAAYNRITQDWDGPAGN